MKSQKCCKILTSRLAIDIFTVVENKIYDETKRNSYRHAPSFMNLMKHELMKKKHDVDTKMVIDLNIGKQKQMEIKFYFNNAVLYIRTLFFPDKYEFFTHETDLAYITDIHGVIKQDLIEYMKRYQPK